MSFRGTFEYSVDDKGRVNIPAKFRKTLSPDAADTFVIIRAPGPCLRAYPEDVWRTRYEDKYFSLPDTPENLKLKRHISDSLSDSVLDAQGRISITQSQMRIAGIAKSVTMVGMSDVIEIWDAESYRARMSAADDFDEVFFAAESARGRGE